VVIEDGDLADLLEHPVVGLLVARGHVGAGLSLQRGGPHAQERHRQNNAEHQSPLTHPPSTNTVWPVIYAARSDASHTIASATSSGCPSRWRGISPVRRDSISEGVMASSCERLAINCFKRSVAV